MPDSEREQDKKTILLVEDDDGLRELAVKVLSRAGYRVHSAGIHHQAEGIVREHGESIDLLLTDVVMPEVGGKELADRFKAQFPRLVVLFMSGYTDEVILKQGVMEGTTHFLQKPFTPSSLVAKVSELLGGDQSRRASASLPEK
ncbi:MAG TPA: response regulator [Terriglobales bacterium]|nr:response regulator [Terriglobales bacterium]